jgi:hypothetical protein
VVFVHIIAGKWRDTAAKKQLYRRIAEILSHKPGLRTEDVLIALTLNDRDDWSFGRGEAPYVKEEA